ncbi:MAG: hypothetical protein KIT56_10015, partial [Gammaproteobacteria bacterium]|nr:hypothetical protein [Gammaproteobacteria bacterium]
LKIGALQIKGDVSMDDINEILTHYPSLDHLEILNSSITLQQLVKLLCAYPQLSNLTLIRCTNLHDSNSNHIDLFESNTLSHLTNLNILNSPMHPHFLNNLLKHTLQLSNESHPCLPTSKKIGATAYEMAIEYV